jgi:hypothetical protein
MRKRLNHLLRRPDRCRMLCDVEMHDPPAVVEQDDERTGLDL